MANQQHIEWLNEGVEAWNNRRERCMFSPDFSRAILGAADPISIIRQGGKKAEWARKPLQGINLSGANLSYANLILADLTNADLSNANLAQANLSQSVFNGARMCGAQLQGAIIKQAELTGADLTSAWLTEAALHGANLTDANLIGTNLTGTFFYGAYVTKANLVRTNLADVANLPPELWKAKLYPEHRSPEQFNLQSTSVESIDGLLQQIRQIKDFYEHSHDGISLYFRGEPQCGWDLRPSVLRDSNLFASEGRMLVELVSRRPEEFSGASSALAQWVLAQHHGLKTRFLDVTSNPLVALFHACETNDLEALPDGRLHVFAAPRSLVKPFNSDTVSIIANFAKLSRDSQSNILPEPEKAAALLKEVNSRTYGLLEHIVPLPEFDPSPNPMRLLYQLIRTEKPYFDERIDPRDYYRVIVVEPQQSSERIRAQSGAFLVSAFHQRFERSEILKSNPDIPIYAQYELSIPSDRKSSIKDELRLLNITREKLFPGLDASTGAITEQIVSQGDGLYCG